MMTKTQIQSEMKVSPFNTVCEAFSDKDFVQIDNNTIVVSVSVEDEGEVHGGFVKIAITACKEGVFDVEKAQAAFAEKVENARKRAADREAAKALKAAEAAEKAQGKI